MTNSLTDLRAEAAELLESLGIRAFDHVPERWTPPIGVVSYVSPLATSGTGFGKHRVTLDLTVVAPAGANSIETNALDAMLSKIIPTFIRSNFDVSQVDQPQMLNAGSTTYLGTTISVSAEIEIKENQ